MEVNDPFGWVGHTVANKIRVEAVAAEGGFAVVYQATLLGFGERVALKCLKVPAQLEREERESFLRAFIDEGKLLHRLSRSSVAVVQALDIGAAVSPCGTWTPYLALEWLDGVSLEDDLRERERGGVVRRSLAEVVALLDSAAQALAHAHAEGIAHRDLKPSNLFLANLGNRRLVKVLDFGIAKVMSDAVTTSQRQGSTGETLTSPAFSPHYGAPEQFDRRLGATGPWTDVFAFALVIVELLTGRPALDGHDAVQLFFVGDGSLSPPDATRSRRARERRGRERPRARARGRSRGAVRDPWGHVAGARGGRARRRCGAVGPARGAGRAKRAEPARPRQAARVVQHDALSGARRPHRSHARWRRSRGRHGPAPPRAQRREHDAHQRRGAASTTASAFALAPGETSGVVETRFGFHIIRRTE